MQCASYKPWIVFNIIREFILKFIELGEAISLSTRLLSTLLLEKRLVQLLGLPLFRISQNGSTAAHPTFLIALGGSWGVLKLLVRQTLLIP
jgi:hypothetical protein